MNSTASNGIVPNAQRLLWAGFMAILAAGVGFGVRGGILEKWGGEFGFNATQLGDINGAGFTSFCFGIIIGGIVADIVGYRVLIGAAFLFHVLSAVVTFMATKSAPDSAFTCLYWGTFIFGVANGTLEAVANPLVATLFPQNRTHYLNILHASWPAGLVLGGFIGWFLGDGLGWHWKSQLGLFLIPTVLYGLMFFGQTFPKSEASEKGLSLGQMFKDVGLLGAVVACFLLYLFFQQLFGQLITNPAVANGAAALLAGGLWLAVGYITQFSIGSWLLFILFVTHALVGAVELGTDGWIQNITGNILTPQNGKILFVFTSMLMFLLRFCSHWIEKNLKISPVGILFVCAVLACIGLNLVSNVHSFGGALVALSVYALGKTFFWPTMLAVVSDRFPRTGAVAISIMGGIGMMSAGLSGSAGLGYAKDRFASAELRQVDENLYTEVKSSKPSRFLPSIFGEVFGFDGTQLEKAQKAKKDPASDEAAKARAAKILDASIVGDRKTLRADSLIPATMAVIYLLLLLYFKGIGGYRPVKIEEAH